MKEDRCYILCGGINWVFANGSITSRTLKKFNGAAIRPAMWIKK